MKTGEWVKPTDEKPEAGERILCCPLYNHNLWFDGYYNENADSVVYHISRMVESSFPFSELVYWMRIPPIPELPKRRRKK